MCSLTLLPSPHAHHIPSAILSFLAPALPSSLPPLPTSHPLAPPPAPAPSPIAPPPAAATTTNTTIT